MNEAELIIQARQGDETAWETLVSQHQAASFRLAYLLLGDADEAEDVAQEAFIRAFRALGRFDESRPFRPWLLSITSNLARNRWRAASRYLAAVSRFVGLVLPAAADPEEKSVQQGEVQAVWQAVRRLQRADQEIIYLRYFLELSEAETAATLGIAPGTVKSRLHRAIQRLRAVLGRATAHE